MKKSRYQDLTYFRDKKDFDLYLILYDIIRDLNLWRFLRKTPSVQGYTAWDHEKIDLIKQELVKKIEIDNYEERKFWLCLNRLKKIADNKFYMMDIEKKEDDRLHI